MASELGASPLRAIDVEQMQNDFAAIEARRIELTNRGQRLMARIRIDSKYFGQGKDGDLFNVCIGPGEYKVLGGPGGQYRLADVDLFAVFDEKKPPVQITFAD